MAKKKIKEQAQAKTLFIELGKSQKGIAEMLGVAEKTISRWVNEGNWESERAARQMAAQNIRQNGKLAMGNLSEILLELQTKRNEELKKEIPDKTEIEELDKKILSYTHAIAQAGSQVSKIIEENKITLSVYLQVMEDVFNNLMAEDSSLHAKTLDFQERHIQFICKKLG